MNGGTIYTPFEYRAIQIMSEDDLRKLIDELVNLRRSVTFCQEVAANLVNWVDRVHCEAAVIEKALNGANK